MFHGAQVFHSDMIPAGPIRTQVIFRLEQLAEQRRGAGGTVGDDRAIVDLAPDLAGDRTASG
jgi:hypothetical protein